MVGRRGMLRRIMPSLRGIDAVSGDIKESGELVNW
jgi:hypothetical protein